MSGVQIQPYQFGDAERLRFGKYPMLDTVLARWARGIEEVVFSMLGLEVYVGASVVEDMRFAEFFRSLKHARPVYVFTAQPFPGEGLLVLDNRLANASLFGSAAGPADRVRVTQGNQERLQRLVQVMMERFDTAWEEVEPVHARLQKVTTYLFRARVYPPYEHCLVAQLHLSGEKLSARLMVCMPRFMLAGAIARAAQRPVIPAVAQVALPHTATAEELLGPARYEVSARMGTVSLTLGPDDLHVGQVIPLTRPAEGDVVLELNGVPFLVGVVGDSSGKFAVQVTGAYRPAAAAKSDPPSFQPILWPDADLQAR